MTQKLKGLQGYYDRTDDPAYAAKGYDQHIFIAGRILQSAEMNEIQRAASTKLKGIADALFKDGDIVRDCRCAINKTPVAGSSTSFTYVATLEAGAVYVRGQVRGVPQTPAQGLTLTGTNTEVIGLWMTAEVYTDADEKNLLDPAVATQGYGEPGAYRLRTQLAWGLDKDNVQDGEFFPVYYVDNGELRAKEPPPNLDAVTQAIARYDVDSNGSNYVINGMRVSRLTDDANGDQVYSIASGRARVNGFGISQNSARRQTLKINIDKKSIPKETQAAPKPDAANGNKQFITVNRQPLMALSSVLILKYRDDMSWIPTSAPSEVLPNSFGKVATIAELATASVKFVVGTDFTFNPNTQTLSWTTGGKRPGTGDTVTMKGNTWEAYNVPQSDIEDKGFYVQDAIPGVIGDPALGFTVEFAYTYKLPRIDRLVVTEDGLYTWIIGIASDTTPVAPPVPNNVLSLCQVVQAWTSNPDDTRIVNDGVRMVPMNTLEQMNERLDKLTDMVAQVNLISDINVRDAGAKKGLFVDPFINDDQRDDGQDQDLAITGGCLQLPIKGYPLEPQVGGASAITKVEECDGVDEVILSNLAYTADMKVNPYMSFGVFPGTAILNPQIDRWVTTTTSAVAPETRYFTTTVYAPWTIGSVHGQSLVTGRVETSELAGTSTADAEFLREITVQFEISGWLANETLSQVLFDGVDVTSSVVQI